MPKKNIKKYSLKKKRIKKNQFNQFCIVFDIIGNIYPFIKEETFQELSLKFSIEILKYLVLLEPGSCKSKLCVYIKLKKGLITFLL